MLSGGSNDLNLQPTVLINQDDIFPAELGNSLASQRSGCCRAGYITVLNA